MNYWLPHENMFFNTHKVLLHGMVCLFKVNSGSKKRMYNIHISIRTHRRVFL